MSISYQAKDSTVQGIQLKVQELVLSSLDSIVTIAGTNATIDLKETPTSILSVVHADDSAGTVAPVQLANRTVSGTTVLCKLAAQLEASASIAAIKDSIIIKYTI